MQPSLFIDRVQRPILQLGPELLGLLLLLALAAAAGGLAPLLLPLPAGRASGVLVGRGGSCVWRGLAAAQAALARLSLLALLLVILAKRGRKKQCGQGASTAHDLSPAAGICN